MATSTYPTGVRIWIDGEDCTQWIFDSETLDLTDAHREFEDIDITPYLSGAGVHIIEITADSGVGRVEARVEMG